KTGRRDEANEFYRRSFDLAGKVAADFPGIPLYQHFFGIALYNRAGLVLFRDNDLRQAARMFEQVVGIYRPLVKDYPQNLFYSRMRIGACVELWQVWSLLEDRDRAAQWLREADEAFCDSVRAQTALPGGPSRVADLCADIAWDVGEDVA